jgi:hypothetical protein
MHCALSSEHMILSPPVPFRARSVKMEYLR